MDANRKTIKDASFEFQGAVKSRLLTFVLHYDDLLADWRTCSYVLVSAEPIVLGRSDEGEDGFLNPNKLSFNDNRISSCHAKIIRHDEGYDFITDENSLNGTWVNGERITQRRLFDGDLIEIGHSLLSYRLVSRELAEILSADQPVYLGPTRTMSSEVLGIAKNLQRIAPTPEPILIPGETGAGKEIFAHAVHRLSERPGEFRAVDCGAIPENLFESTFFGHRKGAFTGATESRHGEIMRARNGTLFLDEVANMSLTCQAKLLRVLEERSITPLGSTDSEKVNVRFIAATNRDLLSDEGSFRSDLLRRLAGFVAHLPALRQRKEDLGFLCTYFLKQTGCKRARIHSHAARKLFGCSFPGNIRQLRAILRSAIALAGEAPIEVHRRALSSMMPSLVQNL